MATFGAARWTLIGSGDIPDLAVGHHLAAGLHKVFAVLESHQPPVHDPSVGGVQGHYSLQRRTDLGPCSHLGPPPTTQEPHPAVGLALADLLGVDDAEVAHVVLHAALVQSFQPGNLLLLHSHNELPVGKKQGSETAKQKEAASDGAGGQTFPHLL